MSCARGHEASRLSLASGPSEECRNAFSRNIYINKGGGGRSFIYPWDESIVGRREKKGEKEKEKKAKKGKAFGSPVLQVT